MSNKDNTIFRGEQPGDWLNEKPENGIFRGVRPSDWPKPKQ